jgi:hypothetical protein
MWSRVPKFRTQADRVGVAVAVQLVKKLADNPAEFAKVLTGVLGIPPEVVESLRQATLAGNFEPKLWTGTTLQMMGLGAGRFATMLLDMCWSFREAEESTPLITSDSPIVLNRPPSRTGRTHDPRAGMEIVFPASRQLLFIATWDGHALGGLMRPHLTRQINKLVGLWAEKYVYSPIQIPAILKYLSEPRTNLIEKEYFARIMMEDLPDTT